MNLISWNVNGLRACINKGFMDFFTDIDSDFFCLQEIKLQEGQIDLELPGYHQYWNYAEKKGYSGTAIFTKHEPLSVTNGIGQDEHDQEGRVITLEYDSFYLITVYTPNSQRGLTRLDYRMTWDDAFRDYLNGLQEQKPVIVCGDLNVAHQEIDLKNPQTNRKNAGFTDEERNKFTELLEAGFIDTFRHLYPDKVDAYTWWSYFANSRERNIGWRIDYFLISNELKGKIIDAEIYD
ncbi:MAG: exodeoxyribonuclease III, partial [Firmicutes bacterium]|nr:exodeoxyribonuclease III [Bacillota bacterium]